MIILYTIKLYLKCTQSKKWLKNPFHLTVVYFFKYNTCIVTSTSKSCLSYSRGIISLLYEKLADQLSITFIYAFKCTSNPYSNIRNSFKLIVYLCSLLKNSLVHPSLAIPSARALGLTSVSKLNGSVTAFHLQNKIPSWLIKQVHEIHQIISEWELAGVKLRT